MGGNIYRSGEIFYDVSNRIRQAPVTIANANLGWVPANEAWKISVFGNNITDATYLSSVLVSGTGDSANYARPASFGVRLDLFFGR
ncbi:TonB dependent receptor [compost metagenome]